MVEGIDVRGPTLHKQENDSFGSGFKMRLSSGKWSAFGSAKHRRFISDHLVHQRLECKIAKASGCVLEHPASIVIW